MTSFSGVGNLSQPAESGSSMASGPSVSTGGRQVGPCLRKEGFPLPADSCLAAQGWASSSFSVAVLPLVPLISGLPQCPQGPFPCLLSLTFGPSAWQLSRAGSHLKKKRTVDHLRGPPLVTCWPWWPSWGQDSGLSGHSSVSSSLKGRGWR